MKKINQSLLIAIMLFASLTISFAEDKQESLGETLYGDGQAIVSDFFYVSHFFSDFGTTYYLTGAGILGGTAALMAVDEDIRSIALRNQHADDFFDFTNYFGDKYYVAGVSAAVYLTGLFAGSEEIRTTGRLMTESLLYSAAITTVLKFAAGRARPRTDKGAFFYRSFNNWDDDYKSIPSGHSAAAFSLASVLAGRIDKWWSYLLFYGAAATVPAARIYRDAHWLSDVFLGAAIGTLSGLAVLNAHSGNSEFQSFSDRIRIFPGINSINLQIALY